MCWVRERSDVAPSEFAERRPLPLLALGRRGGRSEVEEGDQPGSERPARQRVQIDHVHEVLAALSETLLKSLNPVFQAHLGLRGNTRGNISGKCPPLFIGRQPA